MDATTDAIVTWAEQMFAQRFDPSSYDLALARLVDSLGCIAAGFSSEPAVIVRQIVGGHPGPGAVTGALLGSGEEARIDSAVFASTVALDYWDANDVYAKSGSGHPSDAIPALVIAASEARRPGRALLNAILISYELFGALNDAYVLRDAGWDQGTYVAACCAIGVGLLRGLDPEALANALCLAITPNIALRQTRAGELAMWKSCSTGFAASSAVLGTLLAERGLTAPRATFEGHDGLFQLITGPVDISNYLSATQEPRRIARTNLKLYPAEHHAQAAIEVAREVAARPGFDVRSVAKVCIATHSFAMSEIADDVAKWRPSNKETADHSLPFLVASTLIHGSVARETFDRESLNDDATLALLGRTSIEEDTELTAGLPGKSGAGIEVTMEDGAQFTARRVVAKGHWSDPLSRSDIDEKAHRLCDRDASDEALGQLLSCAWNAMELDDATEITSAFPILSNT